MAELIRRSQVRDPRFFQSHYREILAAAKAGAIEDDLPVPPKTVRTWSVLNLQAPLNVQTLEPAEPPAAQPPPSARAGTDFSHLAGRLTPPG